METFNLTIKLGNDAMQTPMDVARALRELADRMEDRAEFDVAIYDDNGNRVGRTYTE